MTIPVNETGSDVATLMSAAGVGIYRYDLGSNDLTMDESCQTLFDLPDGEAASFDSFKSRLHPEDLDRYLEAVGQASQGEETFSIDFRVIRSDGTTIFLSSRGKFSPARTGGAPVFQGVCIDVSDRAQLENELRNTQARMQHLADGVPGLLAFIDKDYVLRFLSSQYDGWFDQPRHELVHRHVSEVVGGDTFLRRKEKYDRVLSGETISYEETRHTETGGERHFAVSYNPSRDDAGNIDGFISLSIDITERRETEQSLENKSRELLRSNQELEQFAYAASHDLQAPLRAIELQVQWLTEDLEHFENGRVQENLLLLKSRTSDLNGLLSDLLAYARAEKSFGEIRQTSIKELAADVVKLLSLPAGMQIELDDSLPCIATHHAPLAQVLHHLIGNAIKHHPDREGHIAVYAEERESQFVFSVEDDGAGIPDEYAKKVFEMFQTLETGDSHQGNGMGLAIAKKIIEHQNGLIWFQPTSSGDGAVFKFTWKKLPDVSSYIGDPPAAQSAM